MSAESGRRSVGVSMNIRQTKLGAGLLLLLASSRRSDYLPGTCIIAQGCEGAWATQVMTSMF